MSDETFKEKLSEKEKLQLISDISATPDQFLQMDSPVGKIQLKVEGRDGNKLLVFPRTSTPIDINGSQKIQFIFDKTRYESEVELELSDKGNFKLTFQNDFSKVQRRLNFRTSLPEKWTCKIVIEQINEDPEEVHGILEDLSLKGCFFVSENPGSLMVEDEVVGEISITDFNNIRFKAEVMRRKMGENGKGFGLNFVEIEGKGNETLHSVTLLAARKTRDYTED